MKLDNRDLVLRGILGILPTYLEPYITTVLGAQHAPGAAPGAVRRLLASSGTASQSPEVSEAPDLADLSVQIRVLTARGEDGRYLLSLPPGLGAKLHEVRRFRNEAVHGAVFDADRTLAALVAASETLRIVDAPERGREELRELISAIDGGRDARHSPLDAVDVEVRCAPVLSYPHAVAGAPFPLSLDLSWPGGSGQDRTGRHEAQAPGRDPGPSASRPEGSGRRQQGDQGGQWRSLASRSHDIQGRSHGTVHVRVSVVEDGGGREVTEPWDLVWDASQPRLSETRDLGLVRTSLLQVDGAGSAHVRVEMRAEDGTTAVRRIPGVDLLAPRQWQLAGDRRRAGAALATFAQPDQAAAAALASEALAVVEGQPVPSQAERPDALAAAVCTVLRRRRLHVDPPGEGWDAVQLVRPAAEVLGSRGASALEATVLLASVLERLGVPSTLLLTPGGVLLGYQRGEDSDGAAAGPGPVTPSAARPASPEDVDSLVRRDAMGLVDPTLVARTAGAVLSQPTGAVRSLALDALSDLVLVVAVEAARSQGVSPQPVLERDEDDVVTEVTEVTDSGGPAEAGEAVGPGEAAGPSDPAGAVGARGVPGAGRPESGSLPGSSGPAGPGAPDFLAPPRVEEWRRSLLDLSPRNPLIDRTSRHAVELCVPSGLVGQLEDLINRRSLLELRPAPYRPGGTGAGLAAQGALDGTPDPAGSGGRPGAQEGSEESEETEASRALLSRDLTVDVGLSTQDFGPRLQSLATSARTTLEETGANNLYLAVGTLVWLSDGRRLRSPLILVPVNLVREGDVYGITLDEAGVSTPNYSLLARYEADTGISLTELGEPVYDEHGVDIDATVERLSRRLREEGRDDLVETTAHLGMFRFSTYRMWRDLGEHWPTITTNPLVSHLLDAPGRAFADPAAAATGEGPGTPVDGGSRAGLPGGAGDDGGTGTGTGTGTGSGTGVDEVVENLPLSADANQARVVAEAAAGRTLVVDGPPGTGKSQTVANLIFRALAGGKSVMFVAEKASALDVVARRLREEVGIGDLLLNLHDNGMRPAAVRAALRRALEVSALDGPDAPDRPAGSSSDPRGPAGGQDAAEGSEAADGPGGPDGSASLSDVTDPMGVPAGASDPGTLRRRLAVLRGRLEDYRVGLHGPGPQGVSYYQARQDLVAARSGVDGGGADEAGSGEGGAGADGDLGAAQAAFDARASETGLDGFDAAGHARLLEDYRRTQAGLRSALAPELLSAVLRRRDEVLAQAGPRAEELRQELRQRRTTRSVRELIDTYGDLVTAITPCILVSPDSVARFFPVEHRFSPTSRPYVDVVVFDEASQITVAGAVGAMGRGRSVVVVGDPRQMPPAVQPGGGGGTGGGAGEDGGLGRSVLDWCLAAGVPRRSLTWHYRSRVESLIAFSNRHYYEGQLLSFPSPLTMAARADDGPQGHGVSLRRVKGTYNRAQPRTRPQGAPPNTNPVEARQVVEEVQRRFEASPQATPSLGVITFSARQRDLIETWLRKTDDERIVRALEERDGLFVRNLDNVQGEERDTILFSVTFSANERGDVPLNLGSLGHAGGERRLNVAVTRARRQVVVFASFDPEDLHAERSAHQGIRDLRAYLEMARDGRAPRAQPWSSSVVDLHRNEVAERLREAGLEVSVGVGHSSFEVDLVLAAPGQPGSPTVAVLLDGPGWNARGSVTDRDLLPVDVLHGNMGWQRVERVWVPEWVADERSVVARLVPAAGGTLEPGGAPGLDAQDAPGAPEAGQAGAAGGLEAGPEGAAGPWPPVGAEEQEGSGESSGTPEGPAGPGGPSSSGAASAPGPADYQEWQPDGVDDPEVLDRAETDEDARAQVIEVARAVCDVESPLTRHRLVVKVCRAFGLSRVTGSREKRVSQVLGESFAYVDEHGFVWRTWDRAQLPVSWRRNALDHVGRIEEIHPRELAALMADVRAAYPGWTSPEELCRHALRRLSARRRQLGARGVLPALTRALRETEQGSGQEAGQPGGGGEGAEG